MDPATSYINCGLYSVPDAARLLRVHPNVLRYWAGERDEADALIPRRFPKEHLLTFAELMELQFVKLFRDQGVSLQAIRRAAKAASQKFSTDYPFTVKQFDTDGRSIFATLRRKETNEELVEELRHGQLVFSRIIRPFFKRIDFAGTNEAERFWPLQRRGRIVLDPTRRFGQPIDSETGVPVEAIINAYKAGDGQSIPEIARWFDIPPEAVRAALRFERSLAT